jgi:transposase InsO family protein
LTPTAALFAYTKVEIKTLGKADITVEAFNSRITAPVYVVEQNDSPLFGLNWLLKFGIKLPEGVQLRSVTQAVADTTTTEKNTTVSTPVRTVPLSTADDAKLRQLLAEYSDIFQPGQGTIKGQEAVVHIDPTAKPRAFPPPSVPFPLRKAVEDELDRLIAEGVLEPVDPMVTPIEWASPIVVAVKSSGAVRICGDFKITINPHIVADKYPLPRFEEIAAKLNGCKVFSVIDLKDAYLQLPVAEQSRKYFKIVTHRGYLRYTRLPFGVNFAPSLFQSTLDRILSGIAVTSAYIDDVISGAGDTSAALQRLRAIFDRLRNAGIRTQLSKCRFLQTSVTYLGHRIDADGIHPTDERLRAIRDIALPTNQRQLRSFLGAVNYYAKFIPQLQTRCASLHRLIKKDARWEWTEADTRVFTELKNRLATSDTLVHYDEDKELVLATDASDIGVGAVLMHRFPDNSERPIAFASRVLSETEKRYAAIDKEALAIIIAVGKFQQYLLGRRFVLKTDHRPLERLFGTKAELPKLAANRLSHWAVTLSMYDYDIYYQAASSNAPADMLSRFPVDKPEVTSARAERRGKRSQLLHLRLSDISMSKKQLKQTTVNDRILSRVLAYMDRGWPSNAANLLTELHTYFEKRNELSLEEGALLWKGRLVISENLRAGFLQLLHEGHPGISAMRDLAKFYAWWPRIDQDIEHHVNSCNACQRTRRTEPEVPLFSWSVPSEPWSRVHVDFAGPYEGFTWLIMVDAYTKWLEVIKMKSTTTKATIAKLREVFARTGLPRTMVSDNGPQWIAEEFQQYCRGNSVRHITSSPWHPRTNGLAERAVQTFKLRMEAAKDDVPDLNLRLQRFLFSYRITPHKSTGRPPAEMFMGRRLRSRLDLLKPDIRANLDSANYRQQLYHDRDSEYRSFQQDDPVWILNTTGVGYQPGKIHRRTGPLSYECKLNGRIVRKHADQLRFRRVADGKADESVNDGDQSDADELQTPQPFPPLPLPVVPSPFAGVSSAAETAASPASNAATAEASTSVSVGKSRLPLLTSSSTSPAATGSTAPSTPSSSSPAASQTDSNAAAAVQPRRVLPQRERRRPARPYDEYL